MTNFVVVCADDMRWDLLRSMRLTRAAGTRFANMHKREPGLLRVEGIGADGSKFLAIAAGGDGPTSLGRPSAALQRLKVGTPPSAEDLRSARVFVREHPSHGMPPG